MLTFFNNPTIIQQPTSTRTIRITIGKLSNQIQQTITDPLGISDTQTRSLGRILAENLGIASGIIASASNSTQLKIVGGQLVVASTQQRVQLKGVNVWGIIDGITTTGSTGANCYTNRVAICNSIASKGANFIRLRLRASDWGANYASQTDHINHIVDWRNAAVNAGLRVMFCWWDALEIYAANFASQYTNMFAMLDALVAALGATDPWVVYEPHNEPNNIANDFTDWQTGMQGTVSHIRGLGVLSPIFIDPPGWAHHFSNSAFTTLENFDATLTGGLGHQIVFCKHDYRNESGWTSDTFTATDWQNNGGGTTWDMTTGHLVMESEFGTHNGSGDGTHTTWAGNMATGLNNRFSSQPGFTGFAGFLYNWVDGNTMTSALPTTMSTWGDAFFAAIAPPANKFGWTLVRSDVGIEGKGLTTGSLSSGGGAQTLTSGTFTNKHFTGAITINGNNITLDGCQIDGTLNIRQGTTGTTVRFCSVAGNSTNGITISGDNVVLYRTVSNGTQDNFFSCDGSSGPFMMDECWAVGPMVAADPAGGHLDILELYSGSNITIRRSHLNFGTNQNNVSSCVNIAPYFSGVLMQNIFIYENWIDGGNDVILIDSQNNIQMKDVRVYRNHFGGHQTPFVGTYVPLHNSDNVTLTEVIPAPGSTLLYWPTNDLSQANFYDNTNYDNMSWWSLATDRTGQVIAP